MIQTNERPFEKQSLRSDISEEIKAKKRCPLLTVFRAQGRIKAKEQLGVKKSEAQEKERLKERV